MGPPDSRRVSRVPRYLGWGLGSRGLRIRGCHPLWRLFPEPSARSTAVRSVRPATPAQHCYRAGLGSAPFARRYWGYHCCFLFLPVLRCFSSRGSPPAFGRDDRSSTGRVVPFGYARITGRLHLPAPFRSLPRPSSPSGATGIRRAPFFPFAACSPLLWEGWRAPSVFFLVVFCYCVARFSSMKNSSFFIHHSSLSCFLLFQYVNDRVSGSS